MRKIGLFIIITVFFLGVDVTKAEAAPFKDVESKHWAYQDIDDLYKQGIISGFEDGSYRPNNPVTKAQAAKIVYLLTSKYEIEKVTLSNPLFKDVPINFWAYKEIGVLTELSGFHKTENFYPNKPMTRAEMAKLIVEIYDFENKSSKVFADVSKDEWYFDYVNKLYSAGVTQGVNDKQFNPNGTVTRAQFAAFINRTVKIIRKSLSEETKE